MTPDAIRDRLQGVPTVPKNQLYAVGEAFAQVPEERHDLTSEVDGLLALAAAFENRAAKIEALLAAESDSVAARLLGDRAPEAALEFARTRHSAIAAQLADLEAERAKHVAATASWRRQQEAEAAVALAAGETHRPTKAPKAVLESETAAASLADHANALGGAATVTGAALDRAARLVLVSELREDASAALSLAEERVELAEQIEEAVRKLTALAAFTFETARGVPSVRAEASFIAPYEASGATGQKLLGQFDLRKNDEGYRFAAIPRGNAKLPFRDRKAQLEDVLATDDAGRLRELAEG